MALPQKAIEEFKDIYKKEYGKELADSEARESAENLIGFFKVLYECAQKEHLKKLRLKKEPEGFHLTDGTYNCLICHCQITGNESWYDRLGPKCLLCQKAVKDGVIPSFVCKERDSWYATWELESKFQIKHPTARKLVRQGILKARIVLADNGKPYEYIFLKKENPELIDPERDTVVWKSYKRHRDKVTERMIREEQKVIAKKPK